jgi:hypothetical protein
LADESLPLPLLLPRQSTSGLPQDSAFPAHSPSQLCFDNISCTAFSNGIGLKRDTMLGLSGLVLLLQKSLPIPIRK